MAVFEQQASIDREEHDHDAYAKRVTVVGGSITGNTGNVTLNPSPNHIGSVSIYGTVQSSAGNVTLNTGPNSIGLVTLNPSSAHIGSVSIFGVSANSGNVTLNPSNNSIGFVTLNPSPAHIGSVSIFGTVQSSSGNVTLNTGPNFIGLVTTYPGRPRDTIIAMPTRATFTLTAAGLASGQSRQSTILSNTSNFPAAMLYMQVSSGATPPAHGTLINTWLLRGDGTVTDDGAGPTDAAITIRNSPVVGAIGMYSLPSQAFYGVFDTSPLGPLGTNWGIAITNNGPELNTTAGNHVLGYTYYLPQQK